MPPRRRRTIPTRDLHRKFRKNINLVDRPLFIPSRVRIEQGVYNDGRGYEIRCPRGLPVSHDIDVLNLLLYKAQSAKGPVVQFGSMAELLEELGYSLGKRNYDLVKESLVKWSVTEIDFHNNTFYIRPGLYRTITSLGIMTINRLDRSDILIELGDQFFDFNNSKATVPFNLKLMSTLTPFSKRLCEILLKNDMNFKKNGTWPISFDKIRLKIPVLASIPDSKLFWMLTNSCEEINTVVWGYGMRYLYGMARTGNNNVIIFAKG